MRITNVVVAQGNRKLPLIDFFLESGDTYGEFENRLSGFLRGSGNPRYFKLTVVDITGRVAVAVLIEGLRELEAFNAGLKISRLFP